MTKLLLISSVAAATMFATACTTTGNMERNAAVGAGVGAVAGAIIGNNTGSGDAKTGAAIGAVVGGAGGAYAGYKQDQTRTQANGTPTYYDQAAGRYFTVDQRTGKTYWENGQFRS